MRRWEGNNKIWRREVECHDVGWINLAQESAN